MADILSLKVEPRAKAGKGSARAARREGKIPAVIYGAKKDPVMVTIRRNELVAIYNKGGFLSHQFALDVAGKTERVLPRDLQMHPVTEEPLHVDFLRLAKGQKVTVNVPVTFINEDDSEGISKGGVLNIVRHDVELNVPATDIPDELVADLTGLDTGDSIKISDIKLPEDCEPTITDRDFTIATIAAPSALKAEEAEEAEAEAAEAEAEAAEDSAGDAGDAESDGDES